jgi:lysozyme
MRRSRCGPISRELLEPLEPLEPRLLVARTPGIDVSQFQSTIGWNSVHAAGKVFSFVKATQSNNFTDPLFLSNMTGALAAGMIVGVYHFAVPSTAAGDATGEANWFVQQASQFMRAGFIPPVLDMESGGPSMTTAQLSDWTNEFMNRVRALTGVTPLIYCNTNYATNELNSTVTQWPLWIANWGDNGDPLTTGSPPCGVWGPGNFKFWQYSSTGSVPGIAGNVDLDVFNGDAAALDAFLIQPSDPNLPTVTTSSFLFATAPHRLSFTFNENVAASLQTSDLIVRDNATQAQLLVSSVSYNAVTNTATFTLLNPAPDGRYTATLLAAGVADSDGLHMPQDYALDFFFLRGDANADGMVDLFDFNILSANFGQSPRDFTQGDFDYSGTVDLSDFNTLAQRFGTSVAPEFAKSLFSSKPIGEDTTIDLLK